MAVNRVSGLTSFDSEAMVTQLMEAEKTKLYKVQQNKQYKVWEQEAYRTIVDQMNAIKSEYFNVLKPNSNFRSASLFSQFTTSVTVNGAASTKVSVTGNSDLQSFSQQIEYITQLATKDTYKSETLNLDAILSKDLVSGTNFTDGKPAIFKATMAIGSNSKTIEIDMSNPAIVDLNSFKDALNTEIASEFGASYTNVASVEGNQLKLRSAGSAVSLIEQTGFADSMTWLGVSSGVSSQAYLSKSVGTLMSLTDEDLKTMTINGKSLTDMGVLSTDSISKMSSKINAAGVGANFYYDSLSDKFKVISSKEGSANAVTLSTEFTTKLKMSGGTHEAANDAILSINGVQVVKSENTFTIDGATVTLNGEHALADGPIKFNFKVNTADVVTKIKSFIEVYNGLIESVYGKTTEKVYRSYLPLTDEQKEAMTDDQIKLWESKSKSGVLKNHTDLENVMTKMRRALSDAVEGTGMTLAQMGIETSSNYKENGKLIITDETKLKSAIENNYADVVKLFSSESDKAYLEKDGVTERYKENGLGNRIYDIIQDAVRTTRDSNGKKGALVESAGVKNDLSDITSVISKKISEYDDRIATLLDYLTQKEKTYYEMFSKVETALSKLESQSKSIASQLGG